MNKQSQNNFQDTLSQMLGRVNNMDALLSEVLKMAPESVKAEYAAELTGQNKEESDIHKKRPAGMEMA